MFNLKKEKELVQKDVRIPTRELEKFFEQENPMKGKKYIFSIKEMTQK